MQTGEGADPFAKVKGMISEMIDKYRLGEAIVFSGVRN